MNHETEIRTAYQKQPRDYAIQFDPSESRTEQSHKDSCDMNKIIARFERTGIIEHENRHGPNYGYATSTTFQEALDVIAQGSSMFADLPAKLRKKFDHDPAKFLDFVQNPKNQEELIELGLAHKRTNHTQELERQNKPAPDFKLEQEKDGPKATPDKG